LVKNGLTNKIFHVALYELGSLIERTKTGYAGVFS